MSGTLVPCDARTGGVQGCTFTVRIHARFLDVYDIELVSPYEGKGIVDSASGLTTAEVGSWLLDRSDY
jgi:hypothetical protein